MKQVRFASRIPASGPASGSERVIDATQEAEALGFDAIFIMDHIHNDFERHKQYPVGMGSHRDPGNTLDPHQFETVATLAYLAGATRRIELGVGVLALPLRDPIILGKEIATLDALSGGRTILGIGVSNVSDKPEYRAAAKPYHPYAERYRQIGEYIGAMRRIWEDPSSSFHGDYVSFDDLVVYPKPARHVPVWVGAENLAKGRDHPAVRFALEHADGWMFGLAQPPEIVRARIEAFRETAAEAGRDLAGFDVCFELRVSIAEDLEEARRNTAWIAADQAHMARYAGYMWEMEEREAPEANIEAGVVGTPQEVRDVIQGLVEAGATYLDIWFMYPTYDALIAQMRLFAAEVLPAFR